MSRLRRIRKSRRLRRWGTVVLFALTNPTTHPLPSPGLIAKTPEAALSMLLARRKIIAGERNVHFFEDCKTKWFCYLRGRGVIALGHRLNALPDIYLLHARSSLEERHVLGLSLTYNTTHTRLAEETELVVEPPFAAWTISDGERSQIFLADTRGEPSPVGPDWTRFNRLQNALTNFQETGQFDGIGLRSFEHPQALGIRLGFEGGALKVETRAGVSRIPLETGKKPSGLAIKETTQPKARPGNFVTWAVDRLRAVPWIGASGIDWLKAVAYKADDGLNQIKSDVLADDGKDAVEEALGSLSAVKELKKTTDVSGWPPAAIAPLFRRSLPNEGKWASLEGDPFVGTFDGHAPFATTFLRIDPARSYSQMFVTLWDPRRVSLHMVCGTVEPRSATAEVGSGIIPHEPAVMERVVAAFNGGFQAMHGEFGMMADDIVYLPPKPYAATIAETRDGATAFGTWPDSNVIPYGLLSFRQNLSPLVVDGQINPYRRHWWGGMPEGWTEESRTVRSAICLTRDNFVAYFYGNSADPGQLARALQLVGCTYGIHLDMNSGHSGFEFYRVAKKGNLRPLPTPIEESWQAEGDVPEMPGYRFQARLMTKSTTLMNFPRYIHRSTRDFFYLTLRDAPVPTERAVARIFPNTPILPPTKWAFMQERPAQAAVREPKPETVKDVR
ncbi:MAG: hypothetical protein SFV15_23915 [Polyangiaceae bacterium]|nr:hypothetical protein [Polyangiaceae bacterium]